MEKAVTNVNIGINSKVFFPKCLEVLRHFINYDTSFITKEKYNQMVDLSNNTSANLYNHIDMVEKYLTLFFCHFDNFYAIPYEIAKRSIIEQNIVYIKTVKISENMSRYVAAKLNNQVKSLSVAYCFGQFQEYRDFTKVIGIPIIHSGTIDYFSRVPYNTQNSRYYNLIQTFQTIIGDEIQASCTTLIFASTSLANYGLYEHVSERPRDLDSWYLSENNKKLQEHMTKIDEREKGMDFYGLSVTSGKISMAERYFNFFSSMANAGPSTKYIPTPLMGPPFDSLPPQKIQTDNVAGDGPFLIIRPEDLLFNPDNHYYYNGMKFLTIELEVFRKHLRYLDGCKLTSKRTKLICAGQVLEKDEKDFSVIQTLINNGAIEPKQGFTKRQYLEFLGLDRDLSVPIHNFGIYTSLATENTYKLSDVQSIKILPNKKREFIIYVLTRGFINKILAEASIPRDHVYRRSIVASVFKHGTQTFPIETYTRITDPLTEVVYTHQKVYRNVSLGSLPKTPIKSIYGNLPSCWLWVLTDKGSIDVILVTSGLELITKHLALAARTGLAIIAAGEMRIQMNGDLVFNLLSGSYLAKGSLLVEGEIMDRFVQIISAVFMFNFKHSSAARVYYTTQVLIPENTSPLTKELDLMCSGLTLKDRMYRSLDALGNRFTFTQIEFDEIKKRASGLALCDIRDQLSSTKVKTKDFNISKAHRVNPSDEKILALLSVSDFNVSDILRLTQALQAGAKLINKCSLEYGYDSYRMLPKTSASASVTVLATIKVSVPVQNYVALKIFPATSNKNKDNSLELEAEISGNISSLISLYATPNLLAYVADFDCRTNELFPAPLLNQYISIINNKNKYRTDVSKAHVLMTEWSPGMSLADFIARHPEEVDETFLRSILFQLVYTINVMYTAGIQQNDLHIGNIWITKLPYQTYYSYFISSTHYFAVPVKYVCRIFDFDLALTRKGTNTWLRSLLKRQYGEAYTEDLEKLQESNDVFRVICTMASVLRGNDEQLRVLGKIIEPFMNMTLATKEQCSTLAYHNYANFMMSNLFIMNTLWPSRLLIQGFDMTYLQRGKEDFKFWFGNTLPYKESYIGRMFAFNVSEFSMSEPKQKALISEIAQSIRKLIEGQSQFSLPYRFPALKY